MLEKLSLDGKTVVITGGGTGLGREMSVAMAKAGADLVIASRRMGPIEETADAVRAVGRRAIAVSTDVTDSAQVNALFERAIDEFGKVDVLFNNAGHRARARLHPRYGTYPTRTGASASTRT